jgi:hypothetical protein
VILEGVIGLGKYSCRHFENVVIPCSWNKGGLCGVDAGKCDVKEVK